MRITYRTLGKLIEMMNDSQLDSEVKVKMPIWKHGDTSYPTDSECYPAELKIGHWSLSGAHPIISANVEIMGIEPGIFIDDVKRISKLIRLSSIRRS